MDEARKGFPRTPRTWIEERLEDGREGRKDVNQHVMSVYADPLRAYLWYTPYRNLGTSEDVVQGFFADRLARDEFLRGWRTSGLRLRRWLMNALSYYLKETARRQVRNRAQELAFEPECGSAAPEEVLDRAFAASVVHNALEATRRECDRRGLTAHFDVFHRHYWSDEAYADLAGELGVARSRARVMCRTVRVVFQGELRHILARDGGGSADLEREIRDLLEVLRK